MMKRLQEMLSGITLGFIAAVALIAAVGAFLFLFLIPMLQGGHP